jgi:hypothetical protein
MHAITGGSLQHAGCLRCSAPSYVQCTQASQHPLLPNDSMTVAHLNYVSPCRCCSMHECSSTAMHGSSNHSNSHAAVLYCNSVAVTTAAAACAAAAVGIVGACHKQPLRGRVQQRCHQHRQADTLFLLCSIDSIRERRWSNVAVVYKGLMMATKPKPVVCNQLIAFVCSLASVVVASSNCIRQVMAAKPLVYTPAGMLRN